jgi:radical SAM protein with 4Fe4S-binding SPASM domain
VVLRAEPQYYGTYVAFDYVKAQTEFLDEDEFKILNHLLDRTANIEEVARDTKISPRKCAKFLRRALKSELVRKNEVTTEAFPPKRTEINPELFARFPIPILSAPSSVDVFITSRCNLKCVHCFSATNEAADLSLENLKSIFNQLEKMGVLEVRINGGEPLLHPNIGKVLQMLERRRFRKVILTNGTLLNDEIAKQLKKSSITPTVSLDDSDAGGHDLFRGLDGTFEKTLVGLKTLQKNGVQYGINCCLHAKNLNKIENIVNLAAEQGAYRIAFLNLKQLGRMRNHKEWVPLQREYEVSVAHLMISKAKHRKIDVSLDAFLSCPVLRETAFEAKKGYISCKAGRTTMSIFSDGLVYPCNSVVGDPKWIMGNSKNETLTDVWFSNNWAFFRGAVKTSNLKKCRDCKEIKKCKDVYCRLLPYATTGDPFGPSPKCSSI